jgi:hypothetical protein
MSLSQTKCTNSWIENQSYMIWIWMITLYSDHPWRKHKTTTQWIYSAIKFVDHVTVHHDKFLIIKPTRCTNFSNLFWNWNSTCFRQFLCPSSRVFHCHPGLLTTCEQAVSKPVWHVPLLCVQWKTPDDWQRNCPKHVDFQSKNKLEKLVHLVGSIVRKVQLNSNRFH